MSPADKILFIAGEPSGDLHGAALIKQLKKMRNSLEFYGIGGDKMKAEGMHLVEHISNMAFLGFIEVVKHLPQITKTKKRLLDFVEQNGIKTAVLIDYPGFNLNIAKKLKAMGVRIVYYITPQVWAWGKGRVKTIRNLIDKVLVILPFEKEFFNRNGIDSHFVGHPLIDRINEYDFPERETFLKDNGLKTDKDIITILPGSRKQEILTIFPEAIKAAKKIADEYGMQIAVACSDNIDEGMFRNFSGYEFRLIKGRTYELLKYSFAGIIKSGTSTLEAALFGLPMVIVYRTSPVTYIIGKNLVKLKHIGLVNILAGETVVPELIQNDLNEQAIYKEIKKYLTDKNYYQAVLKKLEDVKVQLGSGGASEKAAEQILGMLGND